MASKKRCLYEILGLQSKECSPEEIRSAYKKLALRRHPDKLIQTGISEEEATASFQELVNAYEVLSDPRERAWYDSHRSQILFSDANSSASSSLPDLFSFFSSSVFSGFGDTGKGFYKVYGDLFGKIYAQEVSFARKLGLGEGAVRDAPLMGNLESPYEQVSAFYNHWLGFCTVMDYCWVDEYDTMAGPNRKSRRLMEEENKKLRKKARKEYNETVRGLVEFVKRRDKRVKLEMVKRKLAEEKRRGEEKSRKKEAEREKLEKARLYTEPEWAKVNEAEIGNGFDEEEDDDDKKSSNMEFYCVVCRKKFKSDKQWKNHEQSKKHREKVAELKYCLEARALEEELVDCATKTHEGIETSVAAEDDVEKLLEQFEDDFRLHADDNVEKDSQSDEELEVDDEDESADDEISILEEMLPGHRSRKNAVSVSSASESHVVTDAGEANFMDYDNRKSTRKSKTSKRRGTRDSNSVFLSAENTEASIGVSVTDAVEAKAMEYDNRKSKRKSKTSKRGGVRNSNLESVSAENAEVANGVSVTNENGIRVLQDNGLSISDVQDFMPHTFEEAGCNVMGDQQPMNKNSKIHQSHPIHKKSDENRGPHAKVGKIKKGKKEKGASKAIDHSCDTCGADFDSRNKLHKHLGETGHATLKSR
ncbi:hypothetical protein Scep_016969 [Stephania cephalantha]|uniref:Uncharacterized protein n=1 Tax=Stephania cephalantha TaxID=152367 RepID=A0AAP0IQH3_9MAGN